VTLRLQCKACPWKTSTVPERDIPGGYCEQKHKNLKGTVARPGSFEGLGRGTMRMMACHESPVGEEQPCVGWVLHQLNEGNNLGLRMMAMDGRFSTYRTVGPQHHRFEDTLPKKKRKRRA
jgi:hypothetical protein